MPERCTRMIVRSYGFKYPCAYLKPCPIHGLKPHPYEEPSPGRRVPLAAGVPSAVPMPRLFEDAA